MSPEARLTAAALAGLRADLAEDRRALARQLGEAHDVIARWTAAPPERPYLVLGAVALHAWYTGLESALERVARVLDGGVPIGETWHRELLSRATAEVPGSRPAILPRAMHADLVALLGFRHFFRHAYNVDLDPSRLRESLDRLVRVAPDAHRALEELDTFLSQAAAAIAEG